MKCNNNEIMCILMCGNINDGININNNEIIIMK